METSVVGRSVFRLDSFEMAMGSSVFTSDIDLPGMLWGKILRSPHPHARILRIDTWKAEALPGVKAVITAEDTPRIKFNTGSPLLFKDKLPLEDMKVRCIGDEVAAVAAVDEETAVKATELIHVEYEILPAVFDAEEAMKPGAPVIHDHVPNNISIHWNWRFGDLERGFRMADHIFEDTFTAISRQAYATLETSGCVARWDRDENLTVWTTTQVPHQLQLDLSLTLNLSQSKVRVMKVSVGGGFGGRAEMYPPLPICALLSKKTQKPVKIVFSREEEFEAHRHRATLYLTLKTGVKKNGTLTARYVKLLQDKGAYMVHGHTIPAVVGAINSVFYEVPNLGFDHATVYTNNPYPGPFRGFGLPQFTFAIESQMDIIAETIEIDPLELRLKNANKPGYESPAGFLLEKSNFEECLVKAAEAIRWREKKTNLAPNRGLGISAFVSLSGWRKATREMDTGSAIVKVSQDGSADVYVGTMDNGQGIDTIMAQIAAEHLGLDMEHIRVIAGDTAVTPFDYGCAANRSTLLLGNAVVLAAEDAKRQLYECAGEMLDVNVENLQLTHGRIHVREASDNGVSIRDAAAYSYMKRGAPIVGVGNYRLDDATLMDLSTGLTTPPGPTGSIAFGALITEVEVDPETGQVTVLDAVYVKDVGFAINPLLTQGQIEGGFTQGLGMAVTEELLVENGTIGNPSFMDYKIPNSMDTPRIKTILVEKHDGRGPFGAVGFGDSAMTPPPAAIANAIYDAVGVRIKDLPLTPEKILTAIKEKGTKTRT